MLSMISYIIVFIGGLNWLSIGLLQFDFVAGLFGSQANIFSRLVYILVGIAMGYTTYLAIRYKGHVIRNFSFKSLMFWKKKKDAPEKSKPKTDRQVATEHGKDIARDHNSHIVDDKNAIHHDKSTDNGDKNCNCCKDKQNRDR